MAVLQNELVRADLWLKTFLEADATLMSQVNGVYSDAFPERVAMPIIRFNIQDQDDVMPIGMHRIITYATYLVRAITRGPDWDEASALADLIDLRLHRASGSGTGIYVQEVYRTEPFVMTTIEGGDMYRHAGGQYHLSIQPL